MLLAKAKELGTSSVEYFGCHEKREWKWGVGILPGKCTALKCAVERGDRDAQQVVIEAIAAEVEPKNLPNVLADMLTDYPDEI